MYHIKRPVIRSFYFIIPQPYILLALYLRWTLKYCIYSKLYINTGIRMDLFHMKNNKNWRCVEIDNKAVKELAGKVGISSLLASVLISRGICNEDDARNFIYPSFEQLHNPFLLRDMDRAVDRIITALNKKERILIYGDYDVDGITSTAVLYMFLSEMKADVDYFIPDRMSEGYGLSMDTVSKIPEKGVSLVITVDCGVTAFDEIEYLSEKSIDAVITDHHECRPELPKACAVVNPHREDCTYPFKELAGVGVVYKLVQALCERLNKVGHHNKYLDLVALGTVADVVNLTGENRIIVKYGIEKMSKTQNIGLNALINVSGIKDNSITSWNISFVLAPRINAAGRMGDASRAVKLFITDNKGEAELIAKQLNEDNKLRQEIEQIIENQAIEIIEKDAEIGKQKVIVAASEGWHHGIIGIVASRITERYYKPCILICIEDGIGKASGRSIEGFNLIEAIDNCGHLLIKYGGHEQAAGLTIKEDAIPEFRAGINEYADKYLSEEELIPVIKADVKVTKSDISKENILQLDMLSPYGAGNPPPLFIYEGLSINSKKTVGDGKHLKLVLDDNGTFFDTIGFNFGDICDNLNTSDLVDVVCSLEINVWNSYEKIQLNLKDIKVCNRTGIKAENGAFSEEQYYYSLDNIFNECLKKDILNKFDITYESGIEIIDNIQKLNSILEKYSKNNKKIAIFVNQIKSIEEIVDFHKKYFTKLNYSLNFCYNYINNQEYKNYIPIIVNPCPCESIAKAFDVIFFYGYWFSKEYLHKLMQCCKHACMYKAIINQKDLEQYYNIVPERNDLAVIYRHFKMNYGNSFVLNNLFEEAERIKNSYRIRMNYFLLKKSIEIFNELGLLMKEVNGKYGMKILLKGNIKEKANLYESPTYRKLQLIKEEI